MFLVRTSLRPSRIHGYGVFAEDPIRAGQVVWQFDPRVDLCIPVSALTDFPAAMQEHLRTYAYTEIHDGVKVMVLCADNAKYVNHSSHPNLIDNPEGTLETATRDIPAGEELTCNYYVSDMAAVEKLGPNPIEG